MSHRGSQRNARQLKFYHLASILTGIVLSLQLLIARSAAQQALYMSSAVSHSAESGTPPQDNQEIRKLELGKPIERELAGAQAHFYELSLLKGQYVHLVVDQRGIDVLVVLFGPDGKKLVEIDSPKGNRGVESLELVVEETGSHRLEVRALDKNSPIGRYEARIKEIRGATEQDRARIPALRAFTEGELLRVEGTAGSIKRAVENYEVALSGFRAAHDRNGEVMILKSIAAAYLDLGEAQKAFDYHDRILAPFQDAGDRDGEASALNDIGQVYLDRGEFQMALDCFGRALPIFQSIGDHTKEARTLRIIGDVYSEIGEQQKAIKYFEQALPIFHAGGETAREALTLYNVGFAYRMSHQPQPALEYLNRALPLFQALGDRGTEASTLIEIAYAYNILNEKQKALGLFARVHQIFKALNDSEGEAYALYGIGVVYSDMGQHQKALEYFNQALSVWLTVKDPSGAFMTLYHIARSERANGNLLAALSDVETVLDDTEAQRGKINSQELRASYFASQRELYEFDISLRMQLHIQRPFAGYDASALQVSERARARSLLELLTEARANIRQDVDPGLLERESALQQPLTAKAERLLQLRSNAPSKEQAEAVKNEIATVEREIEALTTEYQRIETQIHTRSPRYAALTQPKPLSLKQIQQLLDPDTLLLEYALGEERSYLWAVTPTTIQSFGLPKRAEVESSAERVYHLLTARSRQVAGETSEAKQGRIRKADADYPKAAAGLSAMILKEVSAQLGHKRLLIVADGALQYIPFAALPDPTNTTDRRAGADSPLLINHEIVNLPSASTLAVLRQYLFGRRIAAKAIAILADPVFDKTDMRVKTTMKPATQSTPSRENALTRDIERAVEDLNGNFQFPPSRLTAAHWEAEEISKLVPASDRMKALDFAANRQAVTSPELSQYRIVHFATHAFNNSVHPELSGIVLSLVNERGEPQDGFLRLGEIFNLKLPTELVVLSGCQTGLGKDVKGEGLIGLTRGFMYAGAPRMVVSLWSVEDRATSVLMARFYQRMLGEQKQSPSVALRAAQLGMWKESRWKAPYFWAGFVFQGEWKQKGTN
jgi:CHAT domain-containing protein/Tfp pilus assembly protein PilF